MRFATVLRYTDLEPQPWRNGLGVTRIVRPMSSEDGWSLSLATIERRAQFSRIPATRRAQLAIDAVRLEIDGVETSLEPGEQVRFTGEQQVFGASAGEASRVLNLMCAEDAIPLELARVRTAREIPVDALALVVLEGELRLGEVRLRALDSALLDTSPAASVSASRGLYVVVQPLRNYR